MDSGSCHADPREGGCQAPRHPSSARTLPSDPEPDRPAAIPLPRSPISLVDPLDSFVSTPI
jgi:hypothetical protein